MCRGAFMLIIILNNCAILIDIFISVNLFFVSIKIFRLGLRTGSRRKYSFFSSSLNLNLSYIPFALSELQSPGYRNG